MNQENFQLGKHASRDRQSKFRLHVMFKCWQLTQVLQAGMAAGHQLWHAMSNLSKKRQEMILPLPRDKLFKDCSQIQTDPIAVLLLCLGMDLCRVRKSVISAANLASRKAGVSACRVLLSLHHGLFVHPLQQGAREGRARYQGQIFEGDVGDMALDDG